jgi:hypothetical protein
LGLLINFNVKSLKNGIKRVANNIWHEETFQLYGFTLRTLRWTLRLIKNWIVTHEDIQIITNDDIEEKWT